MSDLFNAFYRLFRCRRGLHRRSANAARHDGHFWRSTCKYCGEPMIRDASRTWRLAGVNELAHEPTSD